MIAAAMLRATSRNTWSCAARDAGLVTVGFTGTGGETLRAACDQLFVAPSDDTPVIQQIHLAVAHGICDEIEQTMMRETPKK